MDQKLLQEKFVALQKCIIVSTFSKDAKMQATFNGQVEITDLKIPDALNAEDKNQMVEMLNQGIKQVSQKIQQAMVEIQKEMMMGK